MRLGKVCGFLMKAFLAVLMLFVTAAAMEMEVYDEDDLAYAIDEKCENIILKGEYIPLDFLDQVVIDFDTVLNLNGNKLFSYFQITNGAQVTIKNGGFTAAGDPIIEVCGSDDEERPTVLILEDLKIEASRGIQINNDGYTRVEVNNTEMQALSYHGWCKYPMQLREIRALIFSWMAVTYLVHKGMSLSAMVTRRFLLRMLSWAARPVF